MGGLPFRRTQASSVQGPGRRERLTEVRPGRASSPDDLPSVKAVSPVSDRAGPPGAWPGTAPPIDLDIDEAEHRCLLALARPGRDTPWAVAARADRLKRLYPGTSRVHNAAASSGRRNGLRKTRSAP